MSRSSAALKRSSLRNATEAKRACENSRPIAAPICATSLAGPSRSSRAISDACKLCGTANAGAGTLATVRRAAPSLSASSTAFVISSTNNGMPSVRSTISAVTSDGKPPVNPTRPQDYPGSHRADALELARLQSFEIEKITDEPPRTVGDHHLVGLGHGL